MTKTGTELGWSLAFFMAQVYKTERSDVVPANLYVVKQRLYTLIGQWGWAKRTAFVIDTEYMTEETVRTFLEWQYPCNEIFGEALS